VSAQRRIDVPVAVLYTRPGCHLCDEARERLEAIGQAVGGLGVREVDIEGDERLHAEYLERIPVVEIGGRIVSELILDEQAVRADLARRTR
jgi:glutaredoxin